MIKDSGRRAAASTPASGRRDVRSARRASAVRDPQPRVPSRTTATDARPPATTVRRRRRAWWGGSRAAGTTGVRRSRSTARGCPPRRRCTPGRSGTSPRRGRRRRTASRRRRGTSRATVDGRVEPPDGGEVDRMRPLDGHRTDGASNRLRPRDRGVGDRVDGEMPAVSVPATDRVPDVGGRVLHGFQRRGRVPVGFLGNVQLSTIDGEADAGRAERRLQPSPREHPIAAPVGRRR